MAHKFRVTGFGMVSNGSREDCKTFAKTLVGKTLWAVFHHTVRDALGDSPSGYRVYFNDTQVGWIATDQTDFVKAALAKSNSWNRTKLKVVDTLLQPNGYPGLMVEIIEPENKLSTPPQQEKTKMKVPSLQDLVTANLNAATNAAKLELGAVANDRLAKIIGKRVPAPYKAVLGTPAGHLLLANAVMVAGKAIYPDNKNLGTVSNAMVVSSYQELIKQLDIPGILDELMGDKDIAKALAQEGAKDE